MNKQQFAKLKNGQRVSFKDVTNAVQMIINQIEAGDSHEALMLAVNLLDDVRSKSNPYRIAKSRIHHL